MRHGLSLAALAVVFGVGCNKSPEGGAPGSANSFTITAPSNTAPTAIKQDNAETVKLSLNRGSDFKQNVKLAATAPEGIKTELSKASVTSADPADVNLKITVDKKASLGEHVIKVTGTPDSGSATSVDVKVKVEAP